MTSWCSYDYQLKVLKTDIIAPGAYNVKIHRSDRRYAISGMIIITDSSEQSLIPLWVNSKNAKVSVNKTVELTIEDECDPLNALIEDFDHTQFQGSHLMATIEEIPQLSIEYIENKIKPMLAGKS